MRHLLKILSIAVVVVALTQSVSHAQCDTCPTTVAVAPVVQQTVAVPQPTGWYPGALFDRLRMNRWFGRNAVASTYATSTTAAYTPYTASYAPTTVSTPYVTAYAPLQRTVVARPAVQTSFYRPVVMRPVVAESVSLCAYDSPTCCPSSPCSACASDVSTAIYSAPASDCVGCAAGTTTPSYSSVDSQGHAGPPTPTPALKPETSSDDSRDRTYEEWEAGYRAGLEAARERQQEADDSILRDRQPPADPGPASESTDDGETDSTSSYPGYPKLFVPSNDRTARKPTVDVHQAVYRRGAAASRVSHRTAAPARSQAELDAVGWQAPSR